LPSPLTVSLTYSQQLEGERMRNRWPCYTMWPYALTTVGWTRRETLTYARNWWPFLVEWKLKEQRALRQKESFTPLVIPYRKLRLHTFFVLWTREWWMPSIGKEKSKIHIQVKQRGGMDRVCFLRSCGFLSLFPSRENPLPCPWAFHITFASIC
jgi:hypothetical protein